jgi:hypothetical protein
MKKNNRIINDLEEHEEPQHPKKEERSHSDDMVEEVSHKVGIVMMCLSILTYYRPDFSFEKRTRFEVASQGWMCFGYKQTEIKR